MDEFGTGQQGTGQGTWQNLADVQWGSAWNPQGMSKIGQVPWYGFVGPPPGQENQFYATPTGTSPYTGDWGDPSKGAASFNGPVGGNYLAPLWGPNGGGTGNLGNPTGQIRNQSQVSGNTPPSGATPAIFAPPPAGTAPVGPTGAGAGGAPTTTNTGVVSTTNPAGTMNNHRFRPYSYQQP